MLPWTTPTRSPATYALEAESLFEAGKLSQAEEAYRAAIEIDPRNLIYHVNLARIQVFRGRFAEAEESASNAVLIDPNSALANAVYGWVLDFQAIHAEDEVSRLRILGQALERVEEALAADPTSPLVLSYYAEVLIDNDIARFQEARAAAEKAVQLDPGLMEAHRALGYVWESTGNYDRALDSYLAALRIHPNLPLLHIAVGNMYQALGDIDSAVDSYLRAVSLDPSNPDPLSRIASAEARRGNYGKASQYAADAVDKDPQNPRLHGNLGRMLYKSDDLHAAVEELRLAVQGGVTEDGVRVAGLPLDPGDFRVLEYYYTYALALARVGDCDLSRQIFETLLRVAPDDEIVVANAAEGQEICGAQAATATPGPEATAIP